jgi:hypothetical protein
MTYFFHIVPSYLGKGLGRSLRFVLSNFHVVVWSSKLLKNLKPLVHHFFTSCRQPKYVFGQEVCHLLDDENGKKFPSPVNVDSSFFMKDMCAFFEWSRMHLVPHSKQPTQRRHYLLMTPLTNASQTLLEATSIPLHFCRIRTWILSIITYGTS